MTLAVDFDGAFHGYPEVGTTAPSTTRPYPAPSTAFANSWVSTDG